MAAGGFWINPQTGEPIIPYSNDGDSWYSDSWLDQAISGMPELAQSAWSGINDLGERFFGGGPTDYSGQVNIMEDYARDTIDEYENIIRNPVGYARDNPSATLASLVGLTAGGAGMAGRALAHGGRLGSTYLPDSRTPSRSRAGGITSRLSEAEEAGIQRDFAATLDRLIREERGGPASPAESWWSDQVGKYQKNRQPDLSKKDIEDRTPDDLSEEGRWIRDMLAGSELDLEGGQKPTLEGLAQEAIDRRRHQLLGGDPRALMEGVDNTGHITKMHAQGGAGVTSIRQGRRIGGESQQYAPFDPEVEAPDAKPRRPRRNWGENKLRNDLNPDVNDIPDTRPGPHEGVFKYEAGVGIRDLEARQDIGRNTPSELDPDYEEAWSSVPESKLDAILREGILPLRSTDFAEGKRAWASTDPEGLQARRFRGDEDLDEDQAIIRLKVKRSPMREANPRQPKVHTVSSPVAFSPEDFLEVMSSVGRRKLGVEPHQSTLQRLKGDVKAETGRDLDPDFETKPTPAPARRRVAAKKAPKVPPYKNISGPSPAEVAARKGRAI